jgi:hypothetical protein
MLTIAGGILLAVLILCCWRWILLAAGAALVLAVFVGLLVAATPPRPTPTPTVAPVRPCYTWTDSTGQTFTAACVRTRRP